MNITAFDLAQRYIGVHEIVGEEDHPLILWWHSLCTLKASNDEVPWCSAFVNGIAWELRLPRSKSALARSWLEIGRLVRPPMLPNPGFDVVILKRGAGEQPGPEVINAPGHVGFFVGMTDSHIEMLGGNQRDSVSIARYPIDRVLAIRRLYEG